jgi:PPOX class probable F420-dependent enzyme
MDARDVNEFLAGIKMAVMATINHDGSPHLSPNWYYYDEERLFFVTTKERKKFFNLKRDQRMSVCVYEPPLASAYVVVQGTATIDDLVPTSDLWGTARLVIERYVDADDVDAYVERWKTEPRILVAITPEKIYTRPGH